MAELAKKRQQLIHAAESFVQAFTEKKPPELLFSYFSEHIIIHEHGMQQLAPYVGREFRGIEGAGEYFSILASTITLEKAKLKSMFVDPKESKVSVKGEATSTWKETGQSWNEIWTSLLEFDDEYKIKVYEIWADQGAVYLASKGLLKQ